MCASVDDECQQCGNPKKKTVDGRPLFNCHFCDLLLESNQRLCRICRTIFAVRDTDDPIPSRCPNCVSTYGNTAAVIKTWSGIKCRICCSVIKQDEDGKFALKCEACYVPPRRYEMLAVKCVDCGVVIEPFNGKGRRAKRCVPCQREHRRVGYRGRTKYQCYCKACKQSFEAIGRRKNFCSEQCYSSTVWKRNRVEQPCKRCGVMFLPDAPGKKFCGMNCHLLNISENAERICNHCECVFKPRPGRSGKFCSRQCYFDSLSTRGTEWARRRRSIKVDGTKLKRTPDRAALRKKRVSQAAIERVDRFEVFKRDRYHCWICLAMCKPPGTKNDPMEATVDHVIPISKGGADSYSNCRTAHRICNSLKTDLV